MEISNLNAVKPCRKCGGIVFNANGRCRPCKNTNSAAVYAANPEKTKARAAAWYAANTEKANSVSVAYYLKNIQKIKARLVSYRISIAESTKKYKAQYYPANLDKIKAYRIANIESLRINHQNRRARVKGNGGKLSKNLPKKLLLLQLGKCACCAAELNAVAHHLDHIYPLAKGGANIDSNIQLLCQPCNQSKHAKDPIDFMQSRGFLL